MYKPYRNASAFRYLVCKGKLGFLDKNRVGKVRKFSEIVVEFVTQM